MSKIALSLVAATAVVLTSPAYAAITVGSSGTTTGSTLTIQPPNNSVIPNKVDFDTTSNLAGTYTSYFDFSNDQTGFYNFALITSTLGATITLEQLLGNGGTTTLQTVTGTGSSLSLLTSILMPNTTYRFTYTSNFPEGGGTVSGNASFYAQTAPVPEPATWMLMLVGFAGAGFAMRLRRKPVLQQIA